MPFGFFLPVIWERMKKWYTVTVLGFIFSLCIETIQLVCRVGSFDVDDLLLNTAGGLLGFLVYKAWRRIRPSEE